MDAIKGEKRFFAFQFWPYGSQNVAEIKSLPRVEKSES